SRPSSLLVEAVRDQVGDGAQRLLLILTFAADRHVGPLRGGQEEDAEDALRVDLLPLLEDRDLALDRGGAGVQAETIDDLRFPLNHASSPPAPAAPRSNVFRRPYHSPGRGSSAPSSG